MEISGGEGCRRARVQNELKKLEKAKEISEDELHVLEKDVQDITDASTKNIDNIVSKKEEELLEV